jgi:hypothetical protein
VTDDDYHEGQIERVDPKNNEIFLTLKRVPKSQIVRFKRELNEAAEGEHGAKYSIFVHFPYICTLWKPSKPIDISATQNPFPTP